MAPKQCDGKNKQSKMTRTTRTNQKQNKTTKPSCPKTEMGQSQPWIFIITKYQKIVFIEDSLYSQSIHDQLTLIYGKKTTTNICMNSYI